MLVDAGIIPRTEGRNRPAMEMQKPLDPARDREQARITMIATHVVKRAIKRQRFFAEPLPEMDEVGEAIRVKRRQKRRARKFSAPCYHCQFSRS